MLSAHGLVRVGGFRLGFMPKTETAAQDRLESSAEK